MIEDADLIVRQEIKVGLLARFPTLEQRRPCRLWTDEDLDLLQVLRDLDLAHWVIAKLLSRSTLAVITKAKQLHLHRPKDRKGSRVVGDRRNGIWRMVPMGSPSTA